MITLLDQNKNFDKYNVLFQDAWRDLAAENKLTPVDAQSGKTMFSDLAHYFSYIRDLAGIDPVYLMLPIDEAPFEINANTREIKVPADFAKCSGVQSDNYAEIVTFTIDRYFDYKDLDQAEIAVQWKNEAAKVEGVSFIQLKDLKTYGAENKIRFGWPLTAEMTAAAGNLRFAVRFYTCETDKDGKVAFNYLLNTTPASIPIKETLSVDFNGSNVIKKDNDYNLFISYIINSNNPSYGIPTEVVFVNDEAEFPQEAKIDLDTDTLVLKAQAQTKDMNPLVYQWYRKVDENTIVAIDADDEQFAIEGAVFEEYNPETWPTQRPVETLWTDEGDKKTPYLGGWFESKPADITLYMRKTTLTFVPKTIGEDGVTVTVPNGYLDIAGEYFVKAINANEVNSVYKNSGSCEILIPNPVEIEPGKDLPDHMFLDEQSKTLEIQIKNDGHNPQRFFEVYHSATRPTINEEDGTYFSNMTVVSDGNNELEGNQLMEVDSAEGIINYPLEQGQFGYYCIKPISKLNRVEENTASALCYVSDHPGKPLGTMLINGENPLESVDGDNIPTVGGTIDTDTLFEWVGGVNSGAIQVNALGTIGQPITLQVIPTIENATTFNTGAITYEWKRTLEGITVPITEPGSSESDIEDIDLETGLLKIRALAPETGRYTYTCKILNTISNESNVSKEYSFTIV